MDNEIEYTEETFPYNNWHIEITEDNKELLNEWKIKQKFNKPINSYNYIKYIEWDGSGIWWWDGGRERGFCISTSDFKQFVLKEPINTPIINENYDTLIKLLNEING